MARLEDNQIHELSEALIRFAQAFRRLPKDLIKAAAEGRSLLTLQESLPLSVAHSLLLLVSHWALRDFSRRDRWASLEQQSHEETRKIILEELRAELESDLKSPGLAGPYMLPDFARNNPTTREFIVQNASQISEAIEAAPSVEEARRRIRIVFSALSRSRQPRPKGHLKIKTLSETVEVGEHLPIEVYFRSGPGFRNVTRHALLAAEPGELAMLDQQKLIPLRAGKVKLWATYKGWRDELIITITGGETLLATMDTLRQSPPGPPSSVAETIEMPKVGSATATTVVTKAANKPAELFDTPMPHSQDLEDRIPTKMLSASEAALAKSASNSDLDDTICDGSAAPVGPHFEPSMGEATLSFLKQDSPPSAPPAPSEVNPLVMSLLLIPPAEFGAGYEVFIDGQRAVGVGLVFIQHLLLRPGRRDITIELKQRSRSVVIDKLVTHWNAPTTAPGHPNSAPPVCFEVFWRFEKERVEQRARLRVLTTAQHLALNDLTHNKSIKLVEKPGQMYAGGLDLEPGRQDLRFLSQVGEHRLGLDITRRSPDWSGA